MSTDPNRDALGNDDNEAYRHQSGDHIHFITRAEYQNLRQDVRDIKETLSSVAEDVTVIKTERQIDKETRSRQITKWGISLSVLIAGINIIIAWVRS